jgi:hypothetical protein
LSMRSGIGESSRAFPPLLLSRLLR